MTKNIDKTQVKTFLKTTQFADSKISLVDEGVSTDVFKLTIENENFYLRILPLEETVWTQKLAHEKMSQLNISIPKIVYIQDNNPIFDNRGCMIVEEIRGNSLKSTHTKINKESLEEIINKAGQELALINSLKVKGVGYIAETKDNELVADTNNYNDFLLNSIPKKLNELVDSLIINKSLSSKLEKFISNNQNLLNIENNSFLAHGDFSLVHIFQNNNEYSGIIDFGDISGTTKFHDLSHFYIYNTNYFDSLINGYETVYKLPENYMQNILVEAVVIGIDKLSWRSRNLPETVCNYRALSFLNKLQI